MTDAAVLAYHKRREERLAARGAKAKKRDQFRSSKDAFRKDDPIIKKDLFNTDAPDGGEEEQENSNQGRGGNHGHTGGSTFTGGSSGGHGNTRLPFGLCKKFGIEVEDSWTPRDAWDALAGKGITPEGAFKKLREGKPITPEVEPKEPIRTIKGVYGGDIEYEKLVGRKSTYARRGRDPWTLSGKAVPETLPKDYKWASSIWLSFRTKTDMLHYLKERGLEEFQDPETGEIVNPKEMDLPKMLFKTSDSDRSGYAKAAIGMKDDTYAVTGTDFDGKKHVLKQFETYKEAQKWLEERGVSEEDIKVSPALKKREKERVTWRTSTKKEYIEADGTRYGDLKLEHGTFGGRWHITGEDSEGRFKTMTFLTRTEAMKYLKDQGVETVREGKAKINPQDMEIPDTVAKIGGRDYQEVRLTPSYYGDGLYLEGKDLDGTVSVLTYTRGKETTTAFRERVKSEYGLTDDQITIPEATKVYIEEAEKKEAERERRRKEFEAKAVFLRGGGRYADIELMSDGGTYYRLYGYNEEGDKQLIRIFSSFPEAYHMCVDQYGLGPESIISEQKIKDEWKALADYRSKFESVSIDYGGLRYADIKLVKDSDGNYRLVGKDSLGRERGLTPSTSLSKLEEYAESRGLTDIKPYVFGDDLRKEYEEHRKRMAEFESRATVVSGYKYADVHFKETASGKFVLAGYDKDGKFEHITYAKDLPDAVAEAKAFGLNPDDFADHIRGPYDAYKKSIAEFETRAMSYGPSRYVDIEGDYDPISGWYTVKGTDERGKRVTLSEARSFSGIEDEVTKMTAAARTLDSFAKTDNLTKRMETMEKVKTAVATGQYYTMGRDDAFKDIHAEMDSDGGFTIKGIDVDGNEKKIITTADWDDTIETMEKYGVKDYTLTSHGKTFKRPAYGMHKVLMMRKPEGGYAIYADTKRFGEHALMYESPSEESCRNWLRENNVDDEGMKTRGMNPNDDVQRTHTCKALAKFDAYRMSAIEGSCIDDMTDAEKKDAAGMLAEIFNNGAYRCERSTKSFGKIIENGYLSQIETGKGGVGAAHDIAGRKRCSARMYGHNQEIDAHDYEKCGYLGFADDAEDYRSGTPGYGGGSPCVYTFKKDRMKDRTSYTFGDSLNTYSYGYLKCAGYAGGRPTIEGLTAMGNVGAIRKALGFYQAYKEGKSDFNTMLSRVKGLLNNDYIELQYTGDVTVEDIEKVSFKSRADLDTAFDRMPDVRRKTVIKKLRDNDVKLIYRNGYGDPFEDAWTYIRQKYAADFED